MITQLSLGGYSGRRYGSFAGRAEVVVVVPVVTAYSGGYLYPTDRPRKKFRADDEQEKKAKPIIEAIAETIDPYHESSADYELILRLRLREQGLIYKSLYLKWLKKVAQERKTVLDEMQQVAKVRKLKKRREDELLIVMLLH